VCVRTTGIYCRCVCPVRLPYRRNVEFVPSAAAAEAAGLRPCLRCRPETAPFSPAWNGTRTTVERAFRLIVEEGALDGDGASAAALAARRLQAQGNDGTGRGAPGARGAEPRRESTKILASKACQNRA